MSIEDIQKYTSLSPERITDAIERRKIKVEMCEKKKTKTITPHNEVQSTQLSNELQMMNMLIEIRDLLKQLIESQKKPKIILKTKPMFIDEED